MKLEATELRPGYYAVRPEGQLGTCGWYPIPWTVQYIKAPNKEQAIIRAQS